MMFADIHERLAWHCLRSLCLILWGIVVNLGSAYATYTIGYAVAQAMGWP